MRLLWSEIRAWAASAWPRAPCADGAVGGEVVRRERAGDVLLAE